MKNMEIEQQLLKYFRENSGADVSVDTHLVEEGVIDSMGVMDLIAFMQSSYGLEMDMDDLTIENFSTIHTIKNFIVSKKGA
jgi:acyl carrier protein